MSDFIRSLVVGNEEMRRCVAISMILCWWIGRRVAPKRRFGLTLRRRVAPRRRFSLTRGWLHKEGVPDFHHKVVVLMERIKSPVLIRILSITRRRIRVGGWRSRFSGEELFPRRIHNGARMEKNEVE